VPLQTASDIHIVVFFKAFASTSHKFLSPHSEAAWTGPCLPVLKSHACALLPRTDSLFI